MAGREVFIVAGCAVAAALSACAIPDAPAEQPALARVPRNPGPAFHTIDVPEGLGLVPGAVQCCERRRLIIQHKALGHHPYRRACNNNGIGGGLGRRGQNRFEVVSGQHVDDVHQMINLMAEFDGGTED